MGDQKREKEREWISQIDQLGECVKYLTDLDHIYHSPMQKTVTSMYESEIVEYTNRHRMEETTAKVMARLHHMKSVLCKTIKRTPQLCGAMSHHNTTTDNYYPESSDDVDQLSPSSETSLGNITSDDTISSISGDSSDSGVSTLSDFSHCSFLSSSSSSSLHHRTTTRPPACHLRCDPSIINYLSHNLLTNDQSQLFLDDMNDHSGELSSSTVLPLAESSRRIVVDHDQTISPEDEDETIGPLTSTLVDRWHTISRSYTAAFREDLTVRKNELVQVIRCPHPHWIWVRNEDNQEGFVPTDCLVPS